MGNQLQLQPRCCQPCRMCFLQEAGRHEHSELGRKDGGIFANSSSVLSMSSEEIHLDDHTEKELASEVELWRMETVDLRANASTTEYNALHAQLLSTCGGMDEFEQLKRNPHYSRMEAPSLLGLAGVIPPSIGGGPAGASGTAAGSAAAALAAAAAAEAAAAASMAAAREGTASTALPSGDSGRSRQSAEDAVACANLAASDCVEFEQARDLQQSARSQGNDEILTLADATAVEVLDEEAVVLNASVQNKVAYNVAAKDITLAGMSPKSNSSSDASTFAGFIEAGDRDEHDSRRTASLLPKEDNVRPDRLDMLY
mmetsp:Transcript_12874/g.29125  ORF Transcript_12874/g.29125 Transcript_12874/m.29125 type:complete len:314 (+) Transcript_12874:171-1112(+)